MKNIITSNGQFNVTNALYESIKKNNPELLEAMNIPSKNMLAIAKIYKDVTGNDIDKSEENKILSLYIKHGSDINEFEKALKKDQEKKDNINNKNNKNNKNIENEKNQNNIENKKNNKNTKTKNEKNQNQNDIDFNNYIKNYEKISKEYVERIKSNEELTPEEEEKFDEILNGSKFDKIIEKKLEGVIDPEYIDKAVKRYLNNFERPYDDTSRLSDADILKRNKEEMIEIYNQVCNDCERFKKIKEKAKKYRMKNISENFLYETKRKINDNSIEAKLSKAFAEKGIEFVENNYEDIISGKFIEKNDNDNMESNIDDKELAERIKNLMSLYITNDTISYLNKLCHNSIENSVDNNSPKNKCLKKVRNMIEDKTNDIKELTSLLNSGNTKNETERKESFLYNIIKYLESKAKTDEDKGIKTRALENRLNDNDKNKILNRMKDNIAIKIRESILGIEEQDNDMRKIVDSDENVQEKIYNKWFNNHIDLLLNTNNLLRYLSDNEWNNIEKTLDYPFDKSSVKTSEESVREYIGHIKDTVNKVTFESEIPHSVTNLIEKINSGMSGKILKIPPFLKISKFGEKRIDFLTKELKEFYCDLTKNEGEVLRGYKMIDLYRVIPANDFWKNAIVYNCYTQETYQLVLSYIQRQYRKGEVEMSMNPVATGLKARSTIFSVKPTTDNPNEKIVDRVNKQKFDNISSKDKEIIKKIKRYYFIVVTEGLVQKGAILSKMVDKIKNGLSRKNSLFGIDTSGNHLN